MLFTPIVFTKESEEFAVHAVDHAAEVLGVVLKIHIVGFDDEYAALVLMEDKVLIFLVKSLADSRSA